MKHPMIILRPDFHPILSTDSVTYTEYKYHGKVGNGCYEYIHFWKNATGKWMCFKIYFEKGNQLYEEYQKFLVYGNDESGWSSKFVDFAN